MAIRHASLREQLAEAWRLTIRGPYADQLVNSERGLQVHFCIELLQVFPKDFVARRLFVEPTLVFEDGVRRSPDLLICNSNDVVGVVEFKYSPRALPTKSTIEKDLDTLGRIGSAGSELKVSNERYRGEGDAKRYTIATDAVLCWAGVHSSPSTTMPMGGSYDFGSRFLCLEALSMHGGVARVLQDGEEYGVAPF